MFQPNASGRGELRSWAGFQQRQELKSCGQYFDERVELLIDGPTVTARVLGPFGMRLRRAGSWQLSQLLAVEVESVGADERAGAAFVLVDLAKVRIVAELRAVTANAACDEVLGQLVAPPTDPLTWIEIEERRRTV